MKNKYPKLSFSENKIFDCNKKLVSPGTGIANIEIEKGIFKKFVFDKLLTYLKNNGKQKSKQYKSKGTAGEHRRKPIIVTGPGNKSILFTSSSQAAKELKICRTNIPHVLSGRYSQINGYKIKYA